MLNESSGRGPSKPSEPWSAQVKEQDKVIGKRPKKSKASGVFKNKSSSVSGKIDASPSLHLGVHTETSMKSSAPDRAARPPRAEDHHQQDQLRDGTHE